MEGVRKETVRISSLVIGVAAKCFRWSLLRTFLVWLAGPGKQSRASNRVALDLIKMATPTTRTFTARDERRAFRARQVLWIRYEDSFGNIKESIVDIYHPGNRKSIFTWCRLLREPRAFARHRIQSWRLLNKRYMLDQVTAQYWDEEGHFGGAKRVPWTWWLREQLEKDTGFQQKAKLAA